MPSGLCETPGCGRILQQPVRGRPRRFCETCRPPQKLGSRVPVIPATPVVPLRAVPSNDQLDEAFESVSDGTEGALTAALRAELIAAGRVDTALGVAALTAAASIDHGGHTAAGLAALLKSFRDSRAEALDGAAVKDDILGEIAMRRAGRFGA